MQSNMKKFSKIVENNSGKLYKVTASIELTISAENEGESGYIADSTLAGNEYTSNFSILDIEETQKEVLESKSEIKSELKGNDYDMVSGIIDILKKVKDEQNRIEIAEDMIKQFKKEGIKFDYSKFLDSIK